MGDSKRRKGLGCVIERKDPAQKQKEKVMRLAAAEPVRSGFRPDLGRTLAVTGCDHVLLQATIRTLKYNPLLIKNIFVQDNTEISLLSSDGVAMHIFPAALSCSSTSGVSLESDASYIFTIECLSTASQVKIVEQVMKKVAEGVVLRVGYDRAYRGKDSGEYVVPLMLDLEAIDD